MPLPADYLERVYAGVLGKIIGVYLGRPFEGWSYERIMAELGEITYYVHEKRGVPLIVTDDDISGTFTFLRALPDYGNSLELTPAQIGQTWLNYIIEKKTILWWGGMGNSTEHTAFLRLKHGMKAPQSGSIATNGKVVAEQIGSQIFIDGWAMVAPGDPERAVDLARRAASVSHDGEAIYGAQVIAAMEAQAFVERDINLLIDQAVSFIPRDSVIARMIHDIREWHEEERDWRVAREFLARDYGYDKYAGNCHMVPNHGLIIQSLLYGDDDFQKSLMIVNTSGWDTDCNSANVGCLLGIKNGLAGITGADWRGPVADRMFLPTADGGRAITDAVSETYRVVNIGRALAGEALLAPKQGARFHFELPGSVQGFMPESSTLRLENVIGHSQSGTHSLALRYQLEPEAAAQAGTATFVPPDAINMPGYTLLASPTLYPGQTVRARIEADPSNQGPVTGQLFIKTYGPEDRLIINYGPEAQFTPGTAHELTWKIAETGGAPIAQVGLEIKASTATQGALYLDFLTWDGAPDVAFVRPADGSRMWRRAWVEGVDSYDRWWPEAFRVVQNEGRGLLSTGTREWSDYRVSATLIPHMAAACGIAARVQGMQRYYGLLLVRSSDGSTTLQLVKALDGQQILGMIPFAWEFGNSYALSLQVQGSHISAWAGEQRVFDLQDEEQPLRGGGVALVCEEGRVATDAVIVRPIAYFSHTSV